MKGGRSGVRRLRFSIMRSGWNEFEGERELASVVEGLIDDLLSRDVPLPRLSPSHETPARLGSRARSRSAAHLTAFHPSLSRANAPPPTKSWLDPSRASRYHLLSAQSGVSALATVRGTGTAPGACVAKVAGLDRRGARASRAADALLKALEKRRR